MKKLIMVLALASSPANATLDVHMQEGHSYACYAGYNKWTDWGTVRKVSENSVVWDHFGANYITNHIPYLSGVATPISYQQYPKNVQMISDLKVFDWCYEIVLPQ